MLAAIAISTVISIPQLTYHINAGVDRGISSGDELGPYRGATAATLALQQ
jgi:hypothetical protein